MSKVEVMEVLKNGVKVYDLSDFCEHDIEEAQNVLDRGELGSIIWVDGAYNDRVENNFVGVYEIQIDSITEYNRFIDMLMEHSLEHVPTLEEWKNNKVNINGREIKLGKWMRKECVDDEIIDFYSQQVRTGKETYYFVATDYAQHIAGMTEYASDWHSCQNVDDVENGKGVGGSLHDDKLLIGMLIDDLEALEDMDERLLARVNMRICNYEGEQVLIPSRYYGSVKNKEILDRCLKQLHEIGIFDRDVRENYNHTLHERCNGAYEITMCDEVHVQETFEDYDIEIECPQCDRNGQYEVYSHRLDRDVKIECPFCNGSGTLYAYVNVDVDEYIDVEDTTEVTTYTDDYSHHGYSMSINVNEDILRAWKESRKSLKESV